MVDSRPPGFRGFLRRLATTLDASDSLIESMVGLVVIIGVTSSSRIGFVDPALGVDAVLITALLVAIVWAVIDGGFVLVACLFRQGPVRKLAPSNIKSVVIRGDDKKRCANSDEHMRPHTCASCLKLTLIS